jgi:hypothetical protein
MALSKNFTVTMQNQNNATSPVAISYVSDPIVQDGVLRANFRNLNPGVFTAGTAPEGYGTNFVQDSNS